MSEEIEPLKVHLTGSDIPMTAPDINPRRRGVSMRSFILTATDPVQQILPNNINRIHAWIRPEQKPVWLAGSMADAATGGNAIYKVSASSFQAQYLPTTDEVWATAASTDMPVTVDVIAIIEGP
ncbi:hypothetical protein GCM10009527_097930 [Actinomadura nitritigenes]|uniref:Uncharacterized protein n=1 Tax=Actinomadura nitritigenes TaxID=134602 RepID=A0ABS3QY50_9ACTN|nr:hypothetical protein [Actinomadura nitritigenes]MBO2438279.1 hypothetical protein [Actinomadura nitritigenes]